MAGITHVPDSGMPQLGRQRHVSRHAYRQNGMTWPVIPHTLGNNVNTGWVTIKKGN